MRQALGLHKGGASHAPQQQPDQARQRHRFVRDGEVPVVMLSSRKDAEADGAHGNRIAALEAALHGERAARAATERSLHEAQTTIQSLQTKLAHAELAHREALAGERGRCELAEQRCQQMTRAHDQAETAREQAEQARDQAEQARDRAEQAREQAERRLRDAVLAREAAERELRRIATAAPPAATAPAPLPRAAAKSPAPSALEAPHDAAAKPARGSRGPRAAAKVGKSPKREPQPVKWWLPEYRAKAHGT